MLALGPPPDSSNGYEAAASEFISVRNRSGIGAATVRAWARSLPPGGDVLDLGCGHGVPISQTLIDAGLNVFGVDASPTMIAAFRAQFPEVPAECSAVESSRLFDRSFDAAVAWGLIFLLPPDAQSDLVRRVAGALRPGGRFLFTSPAQECEWRDNLTGQLSTSLGRAEYRRILEESGLLLEGEADDEGENHYYLALKPQRAGAPGTGQARLRQA